MKKIILVVPFLLLGFAPHVLAQGFTALAPIPGLTDAGSTSIVNSQSLASFFNNLYKYLIGIAATLAVIEIIWGGLEISTKDSVSKQSAGKERITQAIFGLVLVLSPVLVFSIINPAILNLSLNLPPIDLRVPVTTIAPSGQKMLSYSADMKRFVGTPPKGSGWCYYYNISSSPNDIYICSGTSDSCNANMASDINNNSSYKINQSCSQH